MQEWGGDVDALSKASSRPQTLTCAQREDPASQASGPRPLLNYWEGERGKQNL